MPLFDDLCNFALNFERESNILLNYHILLELNVTPKITPKNLDTQIISKKFLFTEYIEKVPVYRASEKSDDIS